MTKQRFYIETTDIEGEVLEHTSYATEAEAVAQAQEVAIDYGYAVVCDRENYCAVAKFGNLPAAWLA